MKNKKFFYPPMFEKWKLTRNNSSSNVFMCLVKKIEMENASHRFAAALTKNIFRFQITSSNKSFKEVAIAVSLPVLIIVNRTRPIKITITH